MNILTQFKDKEINVDISFPFLNVLSQQDYFEKNVNILICISTYNEEKIIKKIEELNKANIKYPFLKLFLGEYENLEKLPINYNQVKKLDIMENFYNSNFDYDNIIYKKLFCNFNKENLIYLIIGGIDEKRRTEILINYINEFKSLEYLKLINFEFLKENVLQLCKMKTLIIEKCKNIAFEENSLTSLINLSLDNCKINNPYKKLYKLPNLEKCSLKWSRNCRSREGDIYYTEKGDEDMNHLEYFNSIIDFNSIKNLIEFEGDYKQFMLLKNCNLKLNKIKLISQLSHDPVKLFYYMYGVMGSRNIKDFKKSLNEEKCEEKDFILYFENEKNAIEKICNSTELKEVEFEIMSIEEEELLKFNINNVVQKLTIIYNHIENIFKNIIEKFPNASELFMTIGLCGGGDTPKFIIEENANCKINKINIIIPESAF